jgi:hypothetical protein
MAEQSMFWPTTGTGDGISGGYTSDRLASIWKSVLGDGLLKYLNDLEATGSSTTLSINTGAALINGYLYENTSSASIATSTLGTGSYGLYLIANESASALAVSRSVAGTTVASKTVRLALNLTTPTQPYIKLAVVGITSGTITGISTTSVTNRWAVSRSTLPYNYANMYISSMSITTSTDTTIAGTGAVSEQSSDYVKVDVTTGNVTFLQAGTYAIQVTAVWDTNTTNRRRLTVNSLRGSQLTATSFITAAFSQHVYTEYYSTSAGDVIQCQIWQDSGATRTATSVNVDIVKL